MTPSKIHMQEMELKRTGSGEKLSDLKLTVQILTYSWINNNNNNNDDIDAHVQQQADL